MADETPAPAPESVTEPDQVVVKHDGKPTIAVKVHAPFKIYYEGEAYSLSAVDATGPFDILPHHHNFLCMLVPCTLTIQTPNGLQSIKISRALMQVKADRVVVFVDV
jgi:F0F1-type ATP synthase epsilon subunit